MKSAKEILARLRVAPVTAVSNLASQRVFIRISKVLFPHFGIFYSLLMHRIYKESDICALY